ncbi:MAG: hypothetical protein EOP34_07525 [Rickettsiales bacterium]|nr:MAG: hypothetical protein EOP34_07525 [Rickettsiales bacterium]
MALNQVNTTLTGAFDTDYNLFTIICVFYSNLIKNNLESKNIFRYVIRSLLQVNRSLKDRLICFFNNENQKLDKNLGLVYIDNNINLVISFFIPSEDFIKTIKKSVSRDINVFKYMHQLIIKSNINYSEVLFNEAAKDGSIERLNYLYDFISTNKICTVFLNAILEASSNDKVDIIDYLYNKCPNINLNQYLQYIIYAAAAAGSIKCLVFFYEKSDLFGNFKDEAFLIATTHNRTAIMQYLYNAGSNPTYKRNKALMETAQCGEIETFKLLGKMGVDYSVYNNEAIYIAASKGNLPVFKFLYSSCANDEYLIDQAINTALTNDNRCIIEFLYSKGVKINKKSLIKSAVLNNSYFVFKYLCLIGANPWKDQTLIKLLYDSNFTMIEIMCKYSTKMLYTILSTLQTIRILKLHCNNLKKDINEQYCECLCGITDQSSYGYDDVDGYCRCRPSWQYIEQLENNVKIVKRCLKYLYRHLAKISSYDNRCNKK